MKFQPPGGELTFWSALWIVCAVAATFLAATTGLTSYYVLAACVGLPALGMWFDQRWCGYLFTALMVISLPLGLIALVLVDDSLWERAYRIFRIAMGGYFAYLTFRWAHEE